MRGVGSRGATLEEREGVRRSTQPRGVDCYIHNKGEMGASSLTWCILLSIFYLELEGGVLHQAGMQVEQFYQRGDTKRLAGGIAAQRDVV